MATLFAKASGGNWTAAGTWSNTGSGGGDSSGPPTAADNCILESGSGNVTINATSVCRSLDCTSGTGSYTGTLTISSSTLLIGDGTAGAGNVAMKLSSGMTFTLSGVPSEVQFVSSSATQQTITTAGKQFPNATFMNSGNYLLSDGLTQSSSYNFFQAVSGSPTINTNGQSVSLVSLAWNISSGTLTLGLSSVTITGTSATAWSFSSGATLNATTSSITLTGADAGFSGGGKSYGTVTINGSGTHTIAGANTFNNLTITGTAAKTDGVTLAANQVCNVAFNASGNSAINRLLIASDTKGTSRTITSASNTISNADFMDITGAGAASWDLSAITGNSGDCGGNSGITFTTPASQTWSGTTGGNWSTNAWTSRVPLPQDDVVINKAFSASQTITLDMPRAGKSINWTGSTGTPAWAKTTTTTMFGSLTMIAGMTNSGSQQFSMGGRSACTITSAGQTFTNIHNIDAPSGSVALLDDYVNSTSLFLIKGTLDLNGFNVQTPLFNSSFSSGTRVLTLGTGTMSLTGTAGTFNCGTTTGLTVTPTTGTISITDTSASSKTFVGGGLSYGNVQFTTGGTGALIFTGANTFRRLIKNGSTTKTITFPGSTTTTFTQANPLPSGLSGNLITMNASSGSATVSCANAVDCDYLSLTNVVAAGAAIPFYAGTNSTNGGGNTNWLFTDPPGGGGNDPMTSVLFPLLLA